MHLKFSNSNLLTALVVFSDSRIALYGLLLYIILKNIKNIATSLSTNKLLLVGFLILIPYGVFMGIINGNKFEYIARNSASCLFLLLVPVVNKLKTNDITSIAFSSLILIFFQYLSALVLLEFDFNVYYSKDTLFNMLIGYFSGGSSTGHFRLFSTKSTFAVFAALFLLVSKKANKIIHLTLLLFFLFITASKGLILGFLCTFGFYLLKQLKRLSVSGIVLSILIFNAIIFYEINSIIAAIFDPKDISNVTRLIQVEYLINAGMPFGVGWGGELSEIVRDNDSPYGFELAYLDLFHKLGILSLVILAYLFKIYITSVLKVLKSNKELKQNTISLLPLIFLFPAIGNPTLMHPVSFFLFGISLKLTKQ